MKTHIKLNSFFVGEAGFLFLKSLFRELVGEYRFRTSHIGFHLVLPGLQKAGAILEFRVRWRLALETT